MKELVRGNVEKGYHSEPVAYMRYNIPGQSMQLTYSEYHKWVCVELMDWETGQVLFHADVDKQTYGVP